MTGEFWLIQNLRQVKDVMKEMYHHIETRDDFPISIKIEKYKHPRSLDQNDMINAMYRDIAESTGEGVVDVRRKCKLHYGVPILRAHDEEFRRVYDKIVKPHTYPDKLEIMDYLPVTSRMKKPQATEYIDTVQRENAGVVFRASA